jgi:hypothetical protein
MLCKPKLVLSLQVPYKAKKKKKKSHIKLYLNYILFIPFISSMLTKITVMRIFIGPWTNQTRVEQDLYGFEDEKESRTRKESYSTSFSLSLF